MRRNVPPTHTRRRKATHGIWGYKAHIGVDRDSGLVHHVGVTSANVHDVTVTTKLLHGEEDTVNGDSGYISAEKREDAIIRNKKDKKIKNLFS